MSLHAIAYESTDQQFILRQTHSLLVGFIFLIWYGMKVDFKGGKRYYINDPYDWKAEELIEQFRNEELKNEA